MKFIGRQRELESLEREYQKDSSFVVIYGRRRVGKTTLIKEFIKSKLAFYFLATEEVESQSIKRLSGVVSRVTRNPLLQRAAFSDWLDLFHIIAEFRPEEKKVLVIDEFPYLVKSNPAFPSILQNAWDEVLKDSNVMLILCGSLIGMMQKHALSYDSPLYGRRTAQIGWRLCRSRMCMPLSISLLSVRWSNMRLPAAYPNIWSFSTIRKDCWNRWSLRFSRRTVFCMKKPNFLLKDEVVSAVNYFSIIRVMADGNHKLGKIAGALGTETSALTPYLSTLSDLGFVVKETPVTEKNPEKSRKGLYFISDNFVRFWFRYVYPYKGELELDNTQIVLDEIRKDFVQKFVAFAYEDICRSIFADLCREGVIDFVPSRIGAYWLNDLDSDTEIDVMAVDHQNKRFFAGECKYHNKPVDAPVFFALRDKVQASGEIQKVWKGYQPIFGIFSKSGFTQRLVDLGKENPQLFLINEDHLSTQQ